MRIEELVRKIYLVNEIKIQKDRVLRDHIQRRKGVEE